MAYDYRPRAANKKSNGNVKPLLIGLMLGLVIGIAIAAGVAIYIARVPSPYTQNPQNEAQKPKLATEPLAKDAAKPDEKKPYTFYDILEGNQTPKPEKPSSVTKAPGGEPSATGDDKTVFYVQAGAYQTEADADNQKATIALLGFEARVKTATLPDKGTVYRVRLGPFKSQDEATQAKATLQNNGITASLIKIVKNTPSTGVN